MSLLTASVTLAATGSLITLLMLLAAVPVMFNELKNAEELFVYEIGTYKLDSNNIWDDLLGQRTLMTPEIRKYRKRQADTEATQNETPNNDNFSEKCPYGPPGEPGIPGSDGEPGEEGEPGLPGAAYDAPGSDFLQEFCPPCIPGRPGLPGYKGKRGPRGPMGEAGPPGQPGNDGLPGPQGEEGNPGYPGEPGIPGLPGLPGEDGIGFAKGLPGPPGERGLPGMEGEQGPPGERGDDAPPGPRGPQGPEGPKGEPGQRGLPGEPGEPGLPGRDGEYCPCPSRSESMVNSEKIKHKKGGKKKLKTKTKEPVMTEVNAEDTVEDGHEPNETMENELNLSETTTMESISLVTTPSETEEGADADKASSSNAEKGADDDVEDVDDNDYNDEPEVEEDIKHALARTKVVPKQTTPTPKLALTDDDADEHIVSNKANSNMEGDEMGAEPVADDENEPEQSEKAHSDESDMTVPNDNESGGLRIISERVDNNIDIANSDDSSSVAKSSAAPVVKKPKTVKSKSSKANKRPLHQQIVPLEGFVIPPPRANSQKKTEHNE